MRRKYRYQPNRRIVMERIIDRHIRGLLNEQYLIEGNVDILKAFKSAYNIIRTISDGAVTIKCFIKLIECGGFKMIPALIAAGFHYECKLLRYEDDMRKWVIYEKGNIATKEEVELFTIAGQHFVVRSDDKSLFKALFSLIADLITFLSAALLLLPGVNGIHIVILDFFMAVYKNINKQFESDADRAWAIAKDFFKEYIPFSYEDLKKAWGVVSNTFTYGGETGAARKELAHKLRYELKPIVVEMFKNGTIDVFCCVWGDSAQEVKEALTNLKNVQYPTYKDQDAVLAGVNRAKDDGTMAQVYFDRIGYTVMNDDKSLDDFWADVIKLAKEFKNCGYDTNELLTLISREAALSNNELKVLYKRAVKSGRGSRDWNLYLAKYREIFGEYYRIYNRRFKNVMQQ